MCPCVVHLCQSLGEVLRVFASKGLHHAWVLDPNPDAGAEGAEKEGAERPEGVGLAVGVVTLTDILRLVSK